jgi:hypothetical protein
MDARKGSDDEGIEGEKRPNAQWKGSKTEECELGKL